MTSRMIAMTGPGGPLPPRRRLLRGGSGTAVPRPTGRGRLRPAGRGSLRPGLPRPRRARRRRALVIGAMSLVVGLGTAAFTAGGGGGGGARPRIPPQVELYGVEHAIPPGGLPLTGPPAGPPAPLDSAT